MHGQTALALGRPRYSLDKLRGWPQSRSRRCTKGKSQTPPANEPRFAGHSPLSLPTHYPS